MGRGSSTVAVTGAGIWNSLGRGYRAVAAALAAGTDGIRPITSFDAQGFVSPKGGELEGLPEPAHSRDSRARRMFEPVLEEAFAMARLDPDGGDRRGLLLGTTVGGITNGEKYFTSMHKKKSFRRGHAELVVEVTNSACLSGAIARWRLDHTVEVYSTACSASAHAIGQGMHLVREGALDVAVVGGFDPLSAITQSGFGLLRALTPGTCRPFDKKRNGIMIGEGSAFLILETLESAEKRGVEPLAIMSGYGASSDAFHPTAPDESGDGPCRAMRAALADADKTTAELGYINAHGTGTKLNDVTESRAVHLLLDGKAKAVPISSTKAMMGHCMGASGAMEAVVCIAVLREGFIPPTINHQEDDPACDVDCVPNQGRAADVRLAASNSFGFGGNNACLVFEKL